MKQGPVHFISQPEALGIPACQAQEALRRYLVETTAFSPRTVGRGELLVCQMGSAEIRVSKLVAPDQSWPAYMSSLVCTVLAHIGLFLQSEMNC